MDDNSIEQERGLIEAEPQTTTAAIYDRVPAFQRDAQSQLPELRAYAQRNGWPVQEYAEQSSTELDAPRPVLAQLLEDAKAGKFQVVFCGSLQRFGSSVQNVIDNIVVLNNAGVRFLCTSQPAFDTDQRSPNAKILMPLLTDLAESARLSTASRAKKAASRGAARAELPRARAGRRRRRAAPREPDSRARK